MLMRKHAAAGEDPTTSSNKSKLPNLDDDLFEMPINDDGPQKIKSEEQKKKTIKIERKKTTSGLPDFGIKQMDYLEDGDEDDKNSTNQYHDATGDTTSSFPKKIKKGSSSLVEKENYREE